MIYRQFIGGIALLGLSLTSCAVDKKIAVGETFEIPLENHGQGGFKWTVKDMEDIIVVDSFETDKENESGFSESTKHYKLKGMKKGTYTLEFVKVRSFQPDLILDENIKKVKVRIKKLQSNE
jgi:predicted secreted protein